jgi:pimeloyl-ACP methyl ester carboxylesterase
VADALASYVDLSVDYGSIAVPSLHLHGEYEIPQLHRHARYMADRIPGCEASEIPGAGHVSHVDNPEFVVDALREFLDRAFDG